MILTSCAACAAPLPHLAKQCSRCKTRYCGPACQAQHWEEGGHAKLCKNIRKGGGAEQYYAKNKYSEAIAVAVEKCAADTNGQTCYICTEVAHWKTQESLVRGCACRGTAGFAHVSCLAEQAKILVAEAEEDNLSNKMNERFNRWHTCGLCKQGYHGVVSCALGWACWKTYVGRPEEDPFRRVAMTTLGNGLADASQHEDAMSVYKADLSMERILGTSGSGDRLLAVKANLANVYESLGLFEDVMRLRQAVYSGRVKLNGEENKITLIGALNYAASLLKAQRFEEAKSVLRKTIPVTRRVFGENAEVTLKMRSCYAQTLFRNGSATVDDLRVAVTTLEDTDRTARRVFGCANPIVVQLEQNLRESRAFLRAREASSA